MKFFLILLTCAALTAGAVIPVLAAGETVIIMSYAGDVKVFPRGIQKAVTYKPGMIIKDGTRIVTGDESYLMLAFDRSGKKLVKVKANSEVIVKLDKEDKIELIDGSLFTVLRDIRKGTVFRIRTPDAVCGARRTGWSAATENAVTTVAVFEDKVFVRGINRDGSLMEDQVWVYSGYEVKVKRHDRPGKPSKIPKNKLDGMKNEFGIGVQSMIQKKLENITRDRH
ncbi:MAG: FecR domain-containing protein [Candidatus Omnitrophota bacterium]|nr:FecR domain-containing protein [Candidatus Omnitrophota bacterium]